MGRKRKEPSEIKTPRTIAIKKMHLDYIKQHEINLSNLIDDLLSDWIKNDKISKK